MRRMAATAWVFGVFVGLACLISGCDEGGVYDIVEGSLRLAYGIVDVAS